MMVPVTFGAFILSLFHLGSTEDPIVDVTGGKFQGTIETSHKNRPYYSFKGIPFAKPPVDELRYENPDTDFKWEDVKTSMSTVPHCAQAGLGYNEGFEDCLYLSVYTPKMPSSSEGNVSLPVLVWMHGGAYIVGMSEAYKPHLLMNRDMVVVMPQYRLGIFGFYTTHETEGPGNYGMFDQIAALKWVQDNIAKFGGDPNQVTLGGECAGAASALTHMTSPESAGLFHRVIAFGGSPLNPWAIHPPHNRFMLMLSNYFSCPLFDVSIFKKCMREKTTQELVDGLSLHLETMDFLVGNTNMAPVVGNPKLELSHEFLPIHPLESFATGTFTKVPVLLGVTEHIGDYIVDMSYYYYLKYQQEERPKYFERFAEKLAGNNHIYNLDKDVLSNFTDFYLPKWNSDNIEDSLLDLGTMIGDMQYNAGIIATAELLSEHVSTRLLKFGFDGGPKLFNVRHPDPEDVPPMTARVTHGDEMFFFLPETKLDMTSKQEAVSEGFINVIENFINGRVALPDWPEFTKDGLETASVTAVGGITFDDSFADAPRHKWLQFICRQQHDKIYKSIIEKTPDLKIWQHDEL